MCVCKAVYVHMSVSAHEFQKKGMDPLELELQALWAVWCGTWELNLSSSEEQQVLLNTEPSLEPLILPFKFMCAY